MKKYDLISRTAPIAVALITIVAMSSSCVRNDLEQGYRKSGELGFAVAANNMKPTDGTKSSADKEAEGNRSVIELRSADGSIVVPMTLRVSDGISVKPSVSTTKGSLINDPNDPETYDEGRPIPLPGSLNSFTVHAYNTDSQAPLFADADTVANYGSGKWSLARNYYWPQEAGLDVYAYANLPAYPSAFVERLEADLNARTQTLHYTVPNDTDNQTDILMAIYSGRGDKQGNAEILFQHPLTAVRFSCLDSEKIEGIMEITMSGVHYSGTAVQSLYDPYTFVWTTTDEDTDVTQDNDGKPFEVHGRVNGYPFLLIPQKVTATKYIELSVVVIHNEHEIPLNATIDETVWEAGKTYTYFIDFDGNLEIQTMMEEGESSNANAFVKNVGLKDCYVRAMITGYITNDHDEIMSSWYGYNDDGTKYVRGTFAPAGFGSTDTPWNSYWIKGSDGFYYYKKPLKYSTSDITTNLFDTYSFPELNPGEVFEMAISAQAVEYDSNWDYVEQAWGAEAARILGKPSGN